MMAAFLNAQQRDDLRRELAGMKFNRATGRVRSLDPKGRLVYRRNNQSVGVYHTRYDLPTLGVSVILVEQGEVRVGETDNAGSTPILMDRKFEYVDALVEPLPQNQT
jgi:hypothetical protein